MAMNTDIELVGELLGRNKIYEGPTARTYGCLHYEISIGIGADHTCVLTIDEYAKAELDKMLGKGQGKKKKK